MDSGEWSKIITAFFACAYRPALLGLPTEVFAFHFSFLKILLIGVTAGFFGSTVSAFLSEELILFSNYLSKKFFPTRKKKRITRTNRFLIKAKKYFGIVGVASLSPLIFSIPFGTFIAIRFFGYKNRNKTIFLMTASTALWTVILYAIYHRFHHHLVHYFTK
ncbi:MAG TPA: hypothetical protein VKG26_07850 [Bacteroidia bacterium]|nr:hypothetical protein [Bacteroidia bacterium]